MTISISAPISCDFYTNENIFFSDIPNITEYENSFYLINNEENEVIQTSEDLNFALINNPGNYSIQGLFYEGTIIVSSTGGGINTNSFVPTGGYLWSDPIIFSVCNPDEICDNNIDDDNDGLIDNECRTLYPNLFCWFYTITNS